jgi:SsrA-binding protein
MASPQKKSPRDEGVKIVADNRRARFNYTVEDHVEAGLELLGSEVKSLRQGTVNLSDGYVLPKNNQLYLVSVHIGTYNPSSYFAHEPTRSRRLLMHRAEIDRWTAKVKERGYSIIPLSVYFKGGRAKVELGLCRGKTHGDRRESIKERETKRELDRATRRR